MNYSYLADGTKLSALDGDGNGLVYRGPFVYRKGSNGSLTFESASFGGGLLTPIGALLYVKDYLGSVRAVVNVRTGDVYKASKYLAYGSELSVPQMPASSLPSNFSLTLRAGYTGQEDQDVDFGTGLTDFGARQYSPALRRWLTPDPLSEQAYGTSPYAFCNSNPVNYVDVDGEFPDLVWDLASIGLGVKSLVENVRDGNTRAAIGDGLGIAVDVLAAAVPVLPSGVCALRAGVKAADAADDVVDAARDVDRMVALRKSAEIGKEAHKQIEAQLEILIPGTRREVRVPIGEKYVRKDAVLPDGTLVIIKPDTPSGHASAARRDRLMRDNGYQTQIIYYDPKDLK